MCPRMHLNQKGMSILAVVVVMGIVGVAASTIISIGIQKRKIYQQMNVSVSANLVKQKLVGMVMSPQSWQATQTFNTQAFGTFVPGSTVYPQVNIYSPDSTIPYYQTTNTAAGFDLKGNTCSTFSQAGNDNCPFRYDITLKNRVLVNGNWIDTVHFELTFRPASSSLVLNAGNGQYSFDLSRNFNDQSAQSACNAVGGTFDVAANTCTVSLTNPITACATGQTYRGPAAIGTSPSPNGGTVAGTGNCEVKTITATACTGGQVIKGFDTVGNPICGAML